MENWRIFKDPRFQLRFRYPAVTPQGNIVELQEEEASDFARAHLISRDSQEVYFEIRRYHSLLPQTEYQRHRAYLEQRFDQQGFSLTALTDYKMDLAVAHQYSFQWDAKRRVAILIQRDSTTYRIIYDPVSPINVQILSTLQWNP